jgi:hypothetical protein
MAALACLYDMWPGGLVQVVVPKTYTDYTRRRVLTSQWIDGEKLSQSKAEDVTTLVNVGVVCFLYQLLDSGFFMADPHPVQTLTRAPIIQATCPAWSRCLHQSIVPC